MPVSGMPLIGIRVLRVLLPFHDRRKIPISGWNLGLSAREARLTRPRSARRLIGSREFWRQRSRELRPPNSRVYPFRPKHHLTIAA